MHTSFFLFGFQSRRPPRLVVIEKHTNRFAMVYSPDGFGEDGRDIQDVELGSQERLVLVLWDRVGHNQLVNSGCLDAADGVSAEDTVGEERVDFGGTLFLEELCGPGDGVARVQEIVNENADPVCYVTHEHHARVLPVGDLGGAALLQRGLVSG